MAGIVESGFEDHPIPLSPTESKFRVKGAARPTSDASISGPDRVANQSGPSIPAASLLFRRFRVFSLGRAAAITDNVASKAALSGGNDTSSERADFRDGAVR
jgi:hypothetical protein